MRRSIYFSLWALACALISSCGVGKTDTAAIRVSCLGPACSNGGVENYVNTSAQIWTFQNTSDAAVSLDLNFSNLAKGQELAYVFGNGYSAATDALPSLGQVSDSDGSAGKTTVGSSMQAELAVRNALQEGHDEWRLRQEGREAEVGRLLSTRSGTSSAQVPATNAPVANYAIANNVVTGTTRAWVESSSGTSKSYTTTALAKCPVGNGRNVVFWADDPAVKGNVVNAESIAAFQNTLCGSNGAVSRMSRLLGNVWGPVNSSDLIQDGTNGLQDINVVIVSAGKDQPWAGYFFNVNTLLKSVQPQSNEALAFFINADLMAGYLEYTQSVLIHELTHMVYWYQRSVSQNAFYNDTWLNEMAALMSEDILTPVLVNDANGKSYQPTLSYRLPAYLNTGGGLSLVDWAPMSKASPYYSMAAAFGGYLNRQYGLAIYKGLIKDCNAIRNGWTCLDTVIKHSGGRGVDDEFNNFGLTLFGLGSSNGPSAKFSYPTRADDVYVMSGIDLSVLSKYRPSKSPDITTWSTSTHRYFVETANISIFTLTRRGITVPARSRLNIMIRQGSGA